MDTESEQRKGLTPPRRTDGDRQRRRSLGDAAAGVQSDTVARPVEAPRDERFRVVIYLCGAPNADINAPRQERREYAEAFGREAAAEIEDRDGLDHSEGRTGLAQAVGRVKNREAAAVLTPWRSMISPVAQEYDGVAREVESAGGFLHVTDTDWARSRAKRR